MFGKVCDTDIFGIKSGSPFRTKLMIYILYFSQIDLIEIK